MHVLDYVIVEDVIELNLGDGAHMMPAIRIISLSSQKAKFVTLSLTLILGFNITAYISDNIFYIHLEST